MKNKIQYPFLNLTYIKSVSKHTPLNSCFMQSVFALNPCNYLFCKTFMKKWKF